MSPRWRVIGSKDEKVVVKHFLNTEVEARKSADDLRSSGLGVTIFRVDGFTHHLALRWLEGRGWILDALTHQDQTCLLAIDHCWMMWIESDDVGRRAAVDAVAMLLDQGCQERAWPMARELIAHAGDWGHRDIVWPQVVERFNDRKRAARLARCHVGLPMVHP